MIVNLAPQTGAFTSNVFLVTGEKTTLVDVGNDFDVVAAVRERVDDLDQIVLTHTHYDHVENLDDVRAAFDVPVYGFDETFDGVDHAIEDEDPIQLGDDQYVVLHTPGHKDDHVCLYSADAGVLFAGDLVFANGSFGRTDLEEGDRDVLIESIGRVLDVVDETLTAMHTGHGPSVEHEPSNDIELAWQAARF